MSIENLTNPGIQKQSSTEIKGDVYSRLDKKESKVDSIKGENLSETGRIDTEKDQNNESNLTEGQKSKLIESGMSPELVGKASFQDGVYDVKTINDSLEGKTHPETGVKFERKTVEVNGEKISGVFPEFESKFDAKLSADKLKASDFEQFAECNAQLKEQIKNDPDLQKSFSKQQLSQIENGRTPRGYTWHHNEETGKMQLVDSKIHEKTGHTGGKAVWGGGTDAR